MEDAAGAPATPGGPGMRGTPSPGGSSSTPPGDDAAAGSSTDATVAGMDATPGSTSGGDAASSAGDDGAPGSADAASGQTVGTGDINAPAKGPGPSLASTIGGAAFTLVKNWDFGTSGTIRGTSDLVSEFQFHDQFGTIANGTH
jgi:hypothetical protein